MNASGKIVLVVLTHSSKDELLSAEELAERIRQELESGSISGSWIVEKVTVLDESSPNDHLPDPASGEETRFTRQRES